jgi:enoyl-CoA hydratase
MPIELQTSGHFAVMTINRPDALNALTFELIREIGSALDRVANSDARALIITGAGEKAFCAGADIKELIGRTLLEQKRGAALGQMTFAKLDQLPIPSVALLNGYAFGAGLELALACTFRLGGARAKLGLPEIKLGLIPGYGGTQRLARLLGEARAMELILTGRTVSAAEALQVGLIHRLVDEPLLPAATAFAEEFSGFGLPALRFARDAVRRAAATTLENGLLIEQDLSTLAYQTEDAAEGMQAFADKRPPRFRDC